MGRGGTLRGGVHGPPVRVLFRRARAAAAYSPAAGRGGPDAGAMGGLHAQAQRVSGFRSARGVGGARSG
eukprot:1585649-Pleurochrysis_carterae.AAC.1